MVQQSFEPNEGKKLHIKIGAQTWARIPIKTHVITDKDDSISVLETYVAPHLKPGDSIVISEKVIAIMQGRAFPIETIKPSWLAKKLSQQVYKSPYGIGLGSPWTMELAIREVGIIRIIAAAAAAAITKPFGVKGVFYTIAGKSINAIDGPCDYTLPPYNKYAKLAPANPNGVARTIAEKYNCPTVIIDANDLGVSILGVSSKDLNTQLYQKAFQDNPLGQSSEQTPIAILRKE